jgi:hypothetical protein
MKQPSVTRIIAPYNDFSGIDPDVLAHAAARGTLVHDICSDTLRGLWVSPSRITPEVAGYVRSFRGWAAAMLLDVVATEQELTDSALGYLGHLDLLARVRGQEGLGVIDWKTPAATQKAWKVQTAAYAHLVNVNRETLGLAEPVRWRASVRLRKDGSPALFSLYTDPRDFAVFVSLLNCFKYFKEEA